MAVIQYPITLPLRAAPFARGVLSPSSMADEALKGELGSSILASGVSALLLPRAGEDWKNMGDEDGTAASPCSRREARGVVCGGLLVWVCCWERVERAGDAVAESLAGRPLRREEAGEDMLTRLFKESESM